MSGKPLRERLIIEVSASHEQEQLRKVRPAQIIKDSAIDPKSRGEFARDRDRILYSPAWRRLAGVTQVVSPFEEQATLHNRLTHSEKVAQLARAIAVRLLNKESDLLAELGGFSADVCEAAGLAHDLGHPPFGHVGETVLDSIALNELGLRDGFEGNAQTFRIISSRKLRSPLYEGLNLTAATLTAVAKYPHKRVERKHGDEDHKKKLDTDRRYRTQWQKFSTYDVDNPLLAASQEFLPPTQRNRQSLEASVMDVADDITYAVHDLEDFHLSGLIDLARVRSDLASLSKDWGSKNTLNPFVEAGTKLADDYPDWFTESHYVTAASSVGAILSTSFTQVAGVVRAEYHAAVRSRLSDLISELTAVIDVQKAPFWPDGPHISLPIKPWHEVQLLKAVTRRYVITAPDIALHQVGQETVLRELVDMLRRWSEKDESRLPETLREELDIAKAIASDPGKAGHSLNQFAPRGPAERAFLDFICMLTDAQCVALHAKLSGRQLHRIAIGGGY